MRYRTDLFCKPHELNFKTVQGDALIPMALLAGARLVLNFPVLLRGCPGELRARALAFCTPHAGPLLETTSINCNRPVSLRACVGSSSSMLDFLAPPSTSPLKKK